jgi:hypothetical protein
MNDETSEPRKVGRPTDYRREYARQAKLLCMMGATDAELAEFFKCSTQAIYRWQLHFSEFRRAIKMGKEATDNRVERSLYNRAVGYSHPDVHISNYQGDVTVTPITKHYPPDVAAAFIWLKNRRPDLWRDKQEIAHTGLESFAEEMKLARARAGLKEKPQTAH